MISFRSALLVALVALVAVLLLAHRMYDHDVEALENFVAAYQVFDTAMQEYAAFTATRQESRLADARRKAEDADADLQSRASVRISSFLKHDGELMTEMAEIATLSRRELEALVAFAGGARNQDALNDLHSRRVAAHARFQDFSR